MFLDRSLWKAPRPALQALHRGESTCSPARAGNSNYVKEGQPMSDHVQSAGGKIVRARRVAWPLGMVLFALGVLPGNALGVTFQNAGPTLNGDDLHSASVNPFPAIQVSSIASPPGQCVWINTGLNNFITANPTNGTGPSGQGWSYSWAGVATEASVEGGINIIDYFPYVTQRPAVTAANGAVAAAGSTGELGGAVFNVSYTPTVANGAPTLAGIRWIQALNGTLWGNPTGGGSAILDTPFNGGGAAFKSQSNITPFYDPLGFAGTYGANNAYFLDTPQVPEFDSYFTNAEYEQNPIADVQFQVILATDAQTVDGNGITQNALTLYGGEWWGFTYSAVDVPEPASCLLAMLGGLGLLIRRKTAESGGKKGDGLR
jgi:hypothetical protein